MIAKLDSQNSKLGTRVVLHVDMDAFYASVEQREHPEYRGQPVVVGADPRGGSGRGVVAACSYEARKFGIHSAQPISRAYRLCPHAVYVRPNGALYSRVSRAIMAILRRYTDLVEPVSIDEAFLDVTGSLRLFGEGKEIAAEIKQAIRNEQRLTCSIGVAASKFLAKIASDLEKPDGLVVVPPGNEVSFLRDLPVRRIWGVGPRMEERLHEEGIRTIGEVAAQTREFWAQRLGKHGEHLWDLSRGIDERPVSTSGAFKSLSHEHTFSRDTDDLEVIRGTLLSLSEEVARRARRQRVVGKTVTLKWRYEDFTTLTRQTTLRDPTHDAQKVYLVACRLMKRLSPFPQKVRLVGVGLSHFQPERKGQLGLFDADSSRKDQLDSSVDQITRKFGKGSIRKASLLDRPLHDEESFSSFLKK